jgi:hypothetical protein
MSHPEAIRSNDRKGSAATDASHVLEPPPMSPITPPLDARQTPGVEAPEGNALPDPILPFAQGRPRFTHPSQRDQTSRVGAMIAPPIAFDDNTDVLAMKSAISILQMQRTKAMADIRALDRAKRAAAADPNAFANDLAEGRVRIEGDRQIAGSGGSDSESDEDEEDYKMREDTSGDGDSADLMDRSSQNENTHQSHGKHRTSKGEERAWTNLPKPQNVVRCPPINWAKYGVVGEPLDKLHAEQVAAPSQGLPVQLGPGGTLDLHAGDPLPGAGGEQVRVVGVAAPYDPFKDHMEKKGMGR